MKFPLPLGLIVAIGLVLHAPFLRAQSRVPHNGRGDMPSGSSRVVRSNTQLPLPTPTPMPTPSVDLGPNATVTFADGTQVKAQSTNGRFELVGLHLSEAVDIALDFPAILLTSAATAQSLDGGIVKSFSMNPGGAGTLASIRFQAGARPGLYRILVPGLGRPGLLQFWVIDPNNPKAKPPVLNPKH